MIPIIGNIFAPQNTHGEPRHAENADTRQEIKRHDPDQERNRHKRDAQEDDPFQDENSTIISVEALRVFLDNFLKSLNEEDDGMQETPPPSPPTENTQHARAETLRASGKAAIAANAYQSMARRQRNTSLLKDSDMNHAPDIKLEASEMRVIHTLLDDLKMLSEKNIEYLRIEREGSFLQSIVNAVRAIQNGTTLNA